MTYRFGGLQLDPERRELTRDGERVPITAKVFDMLVVLVENRARVMEKGELLKLLWQDAVVEEATLVQTISMLRKVIGCSRGDGPRFIATIPGRGYQFVGEVESMDAPAEPDLSATVVERATRSPAFSRWPVALLILGCASFAGWLMRPKADEGEQFQRPEPLTSYPGREIFPSFSPEGDRVVFMWEGKDRNNWDIYVKLVGQESLQRLTEDPAIDWSPAWSPDGKHIAFVRRDAKAKSSELMVIPAIGGKERSVLRGALQENVSTWNQLARLVAWHPDSEHLIVSHAEQPGQPHFLHAVSIATGRIRKLTHMDGKMDGDMDPAVSPDGRQLAFRRKFGGWNSDVYVVPLTDALETAGAPSRIGPRMFSPAWTKDSRELLMADSPTRPGLWRVNIADGSRRRVREPIEAGFPAVSLGANRSAFSVIQVNIDIWQAQLKGAAEAKPLIASTYIDMVPDFSPDGRRIAFASSRSGNQEVWLCDRDGSNPVQLTHHGTSEADCPSWSPDGKRILYHANEDNFRDVYVVDAAGGTPRRLTNREGLDVAPSWSRDGKWIYFASARTGEHCIWKIPSEGGTAVNVAKGTHAQESVDGRTLFVDQGRALWRMPVAGGAREQVMERRWANANFEVRAEEIYFLGGRALFRYDFRSKDIRKVFDTPGQTTWGLAIAPDGNSAIFAQTVPEEADIMLVRKFR